MGRSTDDQGAASPKGPPFPIVASVLTVVATGIAVYTPISAVRAYYSGFFVLVVGAGAAVVAALTAIVLATVFAATTKRRMRVVWPVLAVVLPSGGCVLGFDLVDWFKARDAAEKRDEARALARKYHEPERRVSHAERCSAAASSWGAAFVAEREARCAKLGKPTCYYWCESCTRAPDEDLPDTCAYDIDSSRGTICCTSPVEAPP